LTQTTHLCITKHIGMQAYRTFTLPTLVLVGNVMFPNYQLSYVVGLTCIINVA